MDGWGKLYKIQFTDEDVLYSGRMVEVPLYMESVEKGELAPQVDFLYQNMYFYILPCDKEHLMQI